MARIVVLMAADLQTVTEDDVLDLSHSNLSDEFLRKAIEGLGNARMHIVRTGSDDE